MCCMEFSHFMTFKALISSEGTSEHVHTLPRVMLSPLYSVDTVWQRILNIWESTPVIWGDKVWESSNRKMSWPLTRTGTEAERWVVYPSGTPERRAGWCAQTWRQSWKHISIKITSGLKIQDPHNYSLFPLNLWEAQSDILSNKTIKIK